MDYTVDTEFEYFDYTNWVFVTGQGLNQARTVGNVAIGQVHKLTGSSLINISTVSNGVVTMGVDMEGQSLNQTHTVGTGVVSQVHKLIAQDLFQARAVLILQASGKGYAMGGKSYSGSLPYFSVIDGISFTSDAGFTSSSSLSAARSPYGASSSSMGYAMGGAVTGVVGTALVETLEFLSETVGTHSSALLNTKANVSGTSFTAPTKGYVVEGPGSGGSRDIQSLTFSSGSIVSKVSALSAAMGYSQAFCSTTKGYTCGSSSSTTAKNMLGLVLATETASNPAATLVVGVGMGASVQSNTSGFTMCGTNYLWGSNLPTNAVNKFEFATETTAQVSNANGLAKTRTKGVSSQTKGYALGGITSNTDAADITSINFSSLTTTTESAVLGLARASMAGVQST